MTSGVAQFAVIQSMAPSVGVDVSLINLGDPAEIERAVAAFAQSANGGLILAASGPAVVHRELIVTLAARYKLPTVYYESGFVTAGGLISYGPNIFDQFRLRSATLIASSGARSQPIFRCRRRPGTNWRSTSRPPRHSNSLSRRPYLPVLTR